MRFGWLMAVAGLVACVLAGDGGQATAAGNLFAYLHDNQVENRVIGLAVAGNGTLTELAGSPFDTNNTPGGLGRQSQTAAFSKKRKLLFVTGAEGISVFGAAADGTLSLVNGSPFGASRMLGVAVVELGSSVFVYVADFDHDDLRGFRVQPNGSLVELTNGLPVNAADLEGLSAAKSFLFGANVGGKVLAFKVNSDGSLVAAPGSPFNSGSGFIQNVNVDLTGRFLYVPDATVERVFSFKVNPSKAKLKPVAGSPFPAGLSDVDGGLAVSQGPVLFALQHGFGAPDIQAFRRDGTGALTALGPAQDSGFVGGLAGGALDPPGQKLVAIGNSDVVGSYQVNRGTGQLTPLDTANISAGVVTGQVVAQL